MSRRLSVQRLTRCRQPVMDCMKRLATDGFVVIVRQVGCQVRSYSAEEIAHFFRLFAETLREAHAEHEQVLHAMLQRDSAKAAASIWQHIKATSRRLQTFLVQAVERRGSTAIVGQIKS
jgi:DNA-binding GntR family transcriptional regulator